MSVEALESFMATPYGLIADVKMLNFFREMGPLAVTGILAGIFFTLIFFAQATNHWQTKIPRAVYMNLVPNAKEADHPGM